MQGLERMAERDVVRAQSVQRSAMTCVGPDRRLAWPARRSPSACRIGRHRL